MGVGGTPAYTFSVQPGGAGGTIDAATGVYTAPAVLPPLPQNGVDVVKVVDSLGSSALATIKVCSPLQLVVDIIQNQMNLAADQAFLWNQKIDVPSDGRLYVALGVANVKTFGSSNRPDGNGNISQGINCRALLDVWVYSRSALARDQKEFVVMALNSQYAESQMEANCFLVSPLLTEFVNISEVDGTAILYKFHIMMSLQYFVSNIVAQPYFDTFTTQTATNP